MVAPIPQYDTFSWLLDHAWAPVSAGVVGVWTHLNGRFKHLEKAKLEREQFLQWVQQHEKLFEGHVKRTEEANREAKEAVTLVYNKLDDLKDLLLERRDRHRGEDH